MSIAPLISLKGGIHSYNKCVKSVGRFRVKMIINLEVSLFVTSLSEDYKMSKLYLYKHYVVMKSHIFKLYSFNFYKENNKDLRAPNTVYVCMKKSVNFLLIVYAPP